MFEKYGKYMYIIYFNIYKINAANYTKKCKCRLLQYKKNNNYKSLNYSEM